MWFGCHLPAGPSMGNAVIGAKVCRAIELPAPALPMTGSIAAAPALA
jgi:hypothetical protein